MGPHILCHSPSKKPMLLFHKTKTDSPLAHILMQFIINENILIKQHKSIIFPIMFTSCTLVNLNKKHKFVYHSHIFSACLYSDRMMVSYIFHFVVYKIYAVWENSYPMSWHGVRGRSEE